jgi:hypothetical protein
MRRAAFLIEGRMPWRPARTLRVRATTMFSAASDCTACKLQRYWQGMLCFEVGDGFVSILQVHAASAEVCVHPALTRPVAHLLCNRHVLPVVLDRLACCEVPQPLIRIPEVPVRRALPRPVAHLLCNRKDLHVVLDGLGIVPWRLIRDAEGAVDKRSVAPGSPHGSTAAATALAACSCAATPRQSAALASCSSIPSTRIWPAVGFAAVLVPARTAAAHSPLCPAFHILIWQKRRESVRVGEGERR